jgi:hypothetical protein
MVTNMIDEIEFEQHIVIWSDTIKGWTIMIPVTDVNPQHN